MSTLDKVLLASLPVLLVAAFVWGPALLSTLFGGKDPR